MKITLVNSDLIGSYKASYIASLSAHTALKNKFFKLVDTERLPVSSSVCSQFFIKFNSPVNDGLLNSNKAVADFFFSSYEYGEKHWDDRLDHLYPYVRMYPFDEEEYRCRVRQLEFF